MENELKSKLPEECIKERLKERLEWDNNYSKIFAQRCINILPSIYNILIAQLSWDRFSQMKWSRNIPEEELTLELQREIAKFVYKENLYVLRHCANHLLNNPQFTNTEGEPTENVYFIEIMKKVKIEHDKDIGDCELIHVAINGQSLSNIKRRKVDCYTMDSAKEIKRRLILSLFFYTMLKNDRFFQYNLNSQYHGTIIIIDDKGQEKEKINVTDCYPEVILSKIKEREFKTLCLLND